MFQEYIKLIESKINDYFNDNKFFKNEDEIMEYINNKSFNKDNYINWYEFYFWIREQGRLTMILKEKKDSCKDFLDNIVIGNLLIDFQVEKMFNLIEIDFINIDGTERMNNALEYKSFCGQDIGSAIRTTMNKKNKKLAQNLIDEIEKREGEIKHAKTVLV